MDAFAVEPRRDAPILVRILVTKREIFEFPLQSPDTEPVGERREHLERFLRDALLSRRRIVLGAAQHDDALGELDDRHAHVVDHRDEHTADVVDLIAGFPRRATAVGQFEQAHRSDAFDVGDEMRHVTRSTSRSSMSIVAYPPRTQRYTSPADNRRRVHTQFGHQIRELDAAADDLVVAFVATVLTNASPCCSRSRSSRRSAAHSRSSHAVPSKRPSRNAVRPVCNVTISVRTLRAFRHASCAETCRIHAPSTVRNRTSRAPPASRAKLTG